MRRALGELSIQESLYPEVATVLDCHGAAVVMWEAAQRDWHAEQGAPVPGEAQSIDESEIVVGCELEVDGKARATMSATWRRFRPRASPLVPDSA